MENFSNLSYNQLSEISTVLLTAKQLMLEAQEKKDYDEFQGLCFYIKRARPPHTGFCPINVANCILVLISTRLGNSGYLQRWLESHHGIPIENNLEYKAKLFQTRLNWLDSLIEECEEARKNSLEEFFTYSV